MAEGTDLDAPIAAVTVFGDGARVQRRGTVSVEPGLRPVVIGNLPASADPVSVRVAAAHPSSIPGNWLSWNKSQVGVRSPIGTRVCGLELLVKVLVTPGVPTPVEEGALQVSRALGSRFARRSRRLSTTAPSPERCT